MSSDEFKKKMTSWEMNLLGVGLKDLPKLLPGLLAISSLAWVSFLISDFVGERLLRFEKSPISPVMIALVLGLSIKLVIPLAEPITPGLKFGVKKVLRLGIILLGIRLTVFDIFKLGAFGVPVVALCIIGALVFTTWINKKFTLPERLGTLIAVGTSICGVTAIVAASPAIDADEEEAAYAITVITIFGLIATIAYPYLADFIFSGQANQVGIFIGTSVHETAQVVGAGQIYADTFSQPRVLDIATISKLVRNVFMAGVIPLMTLYYARKVEDGKFGGKKTSFAKLFPKFIFGFLAMAFLRSLGDLGINEHDLAFGLFGAGSWSTLIGFIKRIAEFCLVTALAGVGLSTNFKSIKTLGLKPFIVGFCASAAVGVISYTAIKLFGNLIIF
jgi:uncharacterized integral membrane protein (TIGR00698 family)